MSGDTMRSAMETAFDEAEEASDEGQQEEAGGSPPDPKEPLGVAEASAEPEDGGKGEAVAGGEGEGEGGEPEPKGEELPAGEPVPVSADAGGDATPLGDAPPAPVSWKPTVREHWAGLPAEVQKEITRRESDITQGLQAAAGHKRVAEEYYRTLAPFQSFIQASGNSPAESITQLMLTAAQLTQGSPAKKAEVIQNIIKEYGVDIGILDEILAGQPVPDDPNASLLRAMDERLAPITDFMGSIGQQRQAQATEINTEAAEELGEFQQSHSEFYEDLREDMADLMEMAANRNRSMTMEQAYTQAAAAHPEIGPIMTQRTAAAAGKLDVAAAANKRNAASSIHGTPNAKGSENANVDDTRALMSELWDEAEGGIGHG